MVAAISLFSKDFRGPSRRYDFESCWFPPRLAANRMVGKRERFVISGKVEDHRDHPFDRSGCRLLGGVKTEAYFIFHVNGFIVYFFNSFVNSCYHYGEKKTRSHDDDRMCVGGRVLPKGRGPNSSWSRSLVYRCMCTRRVLFHVCSYYVNGGGTMRGGGRGNKKKKTHPPPLSTRVRRAATVFGDPVSTPWGIRTRLSSSSAVVVVGGAWASAGRLNAGPLLFPPFISGGLNAGKRVRLVTLPRWTVPFRIQFSFLAAQRKSNVIAPGSFVLSIRFNTRVQISRFIFGPRIQYVYIISLIVYKDNSSWPPLHTFFPLTQPWMSNERTFSKNIECMKKNCFFF